MKRGVWEQKLIKGFASLIFLVAAGVGLVLLLQNRSPNFEVKVTDTGFVPEEITIPQGAIVTWVNEGEKAHWPASNFHPTHGLYPEEGGCIGSKLDACRGLTKGEKFEFAFKHPGRWPVHDHLFPGLGMVVEVRPKGDTLKPGKTPGPVQTLGDLPELESFRKLAYPEQNDLIKDLVKTDPGKAWEYVKLAFVVNQEVIGNAHEFAHLIGNALYNKEGLEGIRVCDATFAFGCYHGVTEKMLVAEGSPVVREIQEGCVRIFPPETSQNYTGCIHGTGHGLLGFEGRDLRKALEDCDQLDGRFQSYCYDGVFMENSNEASSVGFDPSDPWKFCKDLPEKYHYNCARYQSQIFFTRLGSDLVKVGQNCATAPTDLLQKACLESVGYRIAQNAQGNKKNIQKQCLLIPDEEGQNFCIIAAARETIFQEYSDWREVSQTLCQSLKGEWQTKCLESNRQTAKDYFRD